MVSRVVKQLLDVVEAIEDDVYVVLNPKRLRW